MKYAVSYEVPGARDTYPQLRDTRTHTIQANDPESAAVGVARALGLTGAYYVQELPERHAEVSHGVTTFIVGLFPLPT